MEKINTNSLDDLKYILLVDDDATFHSEMKLHCKNWDFTLLSAYTNQEALQLFKKHTPLVILSDLEKKDINGFELLDNLKLYKMISPAFYFMVVTENQEQVSKNKAFLEGAMHYISKPIDWDSMRSRIYTLVQSSLLTRQYQSLYQAVKDENKQLLKLSQIIAQKIKGNQQLTENIELIHIQEQLNEIIEYFRNLGGGIPPFE